MDVDPELQKTKDDTLQIFVEYAKLLSQKSSTEKDSKCSEERRTATEADSSPTAAEETTVPQLTRSKSRDASKDLHPRLVLSVKPPVVVDGHHCRAGADAKQSGVKSPSPPDSSAEASNPISPPAPPVSSVVKSVRPDSHRRNPSLHSTDNSAQAQDPPIDPVLSPVTDFTMSYPPMSSTSSPLPLQGANSPAADERREGLVQSAEHARSVAEPSSKIPSRVSHERRPCELVATAPTVDSDPRGVKARKIADRLKEIGDMVEDEHLKSRIDDIITTVHEAVSLGGNPVQILYNVLSRSELSWRRVVEIFKVLCYVIKYDDQFSTFEKVWYCLLDKIVPWIQDNGGWSAFLRANSSSCHANTPNVVRRHPVPAQSEPVLPGCATPTCFHHPHPPLCVQRDVADGRNPIGRMALTPQMSRPSRREQSSPCLYQSYTQAPPTMSESSSRHRLWSLTERGSFQNEDGQEDIERSISEFDITEVEDDTFANSQEEEREEEEETQDGERTLTSSTLRRALTFPSTPITVPSPNSCSQPDPTSTDDLHSDSGIENLSLSCSPRFSVGGGVGHRHSPMLARNQTSLTSLSSAASAASASPIHTSPSSRKNSSSNGTFSYNGKARPRSSGSFKESSHRQGNEATSSFHRTGSLTRQHPRMTTPTNTTPTRFSGSHHTSWREDPNVRRMSTTAYDMYRLIKAFFESP